MPAPRLTRIIATLGPASSRQEVIDDLVAAGVDLVRLNFSHGERDEHAARIVQVRDAAARAGRHVGILQDLSGPKIRTGRLAGGQPLALEPGGRLTIATGDFAGEAGRVSTTYAPLAASVSPGDRLLLDDGFIELAVESTDGHEIVTRVINGGALGEHKGINAPGVRLPASSLTAKDEADLEFGIAHGVDMITEAVRKGGRIIFVGAGTSGRLGVLEAAEMPPTFGLSPSLVHAIMAGGKDAVFRAKEGVEDDYEEGARAVARLRPTRRDVVVGVSASGITQFVRGALTRARKAGLKIIFVTCWPGTELQTFVDLVIAPAVGPEILTGSTRLKAGTATKMVLNMLTTISMVRVGKTYGNLMVDVQTTSEKLKDRARRIIVVTTGLGYEEADRLLRRARWNVKAAIVMQKAGLPYAKALSALRKADDSVRAAVGEDAQPVLRKLLKLDPPVDG